MLKIRIPDNYAPERRYILHLMMREFLGLDIEIHPEQREDTYISADGDHGLCVADGLFGTARANWLQDVSLPERPLRVWNVEESGLSPIMTAPFVPLLFSSRGERVLETDEYGKPLRLALDVFGSAFFLLTRYEEVVVKERDEHVRFPVRSSLAYQEGFLERPLVNEYLEILWSCLKRLWPGLNRKYREFRVVPTHDVDAFFDLSLNAPVPMLRRAAAETIRRRQVGKAVKDLWVWLQVRNGRRKDPFDTYGWIMDRSERAGMRSVFNLVSGGTTEYDTPYPLDDHRIQSRIKEIVSRGHEIGFHPSYGAASNHEIWSSEFEHLVSHCPGARIKGGRQHFLRFQVPYTWRLWNDAGLEYDSTLGFAERPGFRCGTCYAYPVYDLIARKPLDLVERPLIVMDAGVMDKQYLGLGAGRAARAIIRQHKDVCRTFSGEFTLLWHNARLVTPDQKRLYLEAIGLSGDEHRASKFGKGVKIQVHPTESIS